MEGGRQRERERECIRGGWERKWRVKEQTKRRRIGSDESCRFWRKEEVGDEGARWERRGWPRRTGPLLCTPLTQLAAKRHRLAPLRMLLLVVTLESKKGESGQLNYFFRTLVDYLRNEDGYYFGHLKKSSSWLLLTY